MSAAAMATDRTHTKCSQLIRMSPKGNVGYVGSSIFQPLRLPFVIAVKVWVVFLTFTLLGS
jgi:hypothetical protein